MNEVNYLESTVSEYRALVAPVSSRKRVGVDRSHLTRKLVSSHEWSETGADALASLATKYGAFVLRNVLALAVALEIEDGEIGL